MKMQKTNLSMTPVTKMHQIPVVEEDGVYVFDKDTVDKLFTELDDAEYRDWESIKDELLNIRISTEDLEALVGDNKPIIEYEEWKNKFNEYVINQRYRTTEVDINNRQTTSRKRKVLNKNNPFAAVSITNQSFLYPSKNGYKTLTFTTNRHFIKKELDDGLIYATVPGFKVSRHTSRDHIETMIASDSVSSPLPEISNEKKLIYI